MHTVPCSSPAQLGEAPISMRRTSRPLLSILRRYEDLNELLISRGLLEHVYHAPTAETAAPPDDDSK
jgi:hypothetical protein